jgi:hypothetical protein
MFELSRLFRKLRDFNLLVRCDDVTLKTPIN